MNKERRSRSKRNGAASKPPVNARTRQDFANLINGSCHTIVTSFFEIGSYLIDAKAELAHGEYQAMVHEDLLIDPSTARKLRIIAAHPVLAKRAHCARFPLAWTTLYELAQIKDAAKLEALIEDGTVNPKMTREEAIALAPAKKKRTKFPDMDMEKQEQEEDDNPDLTADDVDEDEGSDASVDDLVDDIEQVLNPLRLRVEWVKDEGLEARAAVADALREHVIAVATRWIADLTPTTEKEDVAVPTKQKAPKNDRAPALVE